MIYAGGAAKLCETAAIRDALRLKLRLEAEAASQPSIATRMTGLLSSGHVSNSVGANLVCLRRAIAWKIMMQHVTILCIRPDLNEG